MAVLTDIVVAIFAMGVFIALFGAVMIETLTALGAIAKQPK